MSKSNGRSKCSNLTLKWGTLKSWDFKEDLKATELLKEYGSIGYSMSAMAQEDTKRQKEIICELIDRVYGKIYLEFDGKYVSHKEAKRYVLGY